MDLLWVIDNDDDLEQDQNIATNALPAFIAAAQAANVDFHMAVTSTDTCSAPGSDQGGSSPAPTVSSTPRQRHHRHLAGRQPRPELAPLIADDHLELRQRNGADEQLFDAA